MVSFICNGTPKINFMVIDHYYIIFVGPIVLLHKTYILALVVSWYVINSTEVYTLRARFLRPIINSTIRITKSKLNTFNNISIKIPYYASEQKYPGIFAEEYDKSSFQ